MHYSRSRPERGRHRASVRYDGGVDGTTAFLFVDLSGFTALTEVHGDRDAADVAERFYALAETSLVGDARIVKTIGDAVMVATSETESAIAIALRLRDAIRAEPSFPMVRTGVHAGVAVERRGDFIGASVNLAARIAAFACSGQIACSAVVADVVRARALADVRSLGEVRLKNIAQPIELFAIADRLGDAADTFVDPICRMCVSRDAPDRRVVGDRTIYFCSSGCALAFDVASGRSERLG